jgi:hypothetical protein
MSNETVLTSQHVSEATSSSPPPYSTSDEFSSAHPTRLPQNLNLSRLAEDTIQQIPKVHN